MSVLISPLKGAKVDDSTAVLSLSSALRPCGRAAPDAVVAAFWAQGSDAGKRDKSHGCCKLRASAGPFPSAPAQAHSQLFPVYCGEPSSHSKAGTREESIVQHKLLDMSKKQRLGKTNQSEHFQA